MTSDGLNHTFVYNQAGRLYQVLQGTTLLASYYYNYKGQRTRKVTTAAAPQGAGTVFFHYDEAGHLIGESAGNGSPIRTYVWRDNVPLAQIDHLPSRRVLYFDVDQLHSPRIARDQTGNIVWSWNSDAFGMTQPTTTAGVTVNLRFPGQYYDQESGLYYNANRDYDSTTGRYVQSDPIGLKGGINTYAYVGGNPLRYVDPYGKDLITAIIGAGIGGIAGYEGGGVTGALVGTVVGGAAGFFSPTLSEVAANSAVGWVAAARGAATFTGVNVTAAVVGTATTNAINGEPVTKDIGGAAAIAAIAPIASGEIGIVAAGEGAVSAITANSFSIGTGIAGMVGTAIDPNSEHGFPHGNSNNTCH